MALMKITSSVSVVLLLLLKFFLVITVNTIHSKPLWPGNPLENKLLPTNVYSLLSSLNNQFLSGECFTLSGKNYINIILASWVKTLSSDVAIKINTGGDHFSNDKKVLSQCHNVTMSQCQTVRLTESGVSLDRESIIGMLVISDMSCSVQ